MYLFAVFIIGACVKTCVAGAVFRALLFLSCWVKTSNATVDPFRGTDWTSPVWSNVQIYFVCF